MSGLRVLVSGASITGPVLAYWLVRAGCKVTIVERAPALRSAGQGIDVKDTARDVVKRMGILDALLEKSSHEEGAHLVKENGRPFASFPADFSGDGLSPCCDIEILRGEMAGILYDITKKDVSYIFGDMVSRIEDTKDEVNVHFANGTPSSTFDLVVAADGMGSKIRSMTFGKEAENIRSLSSVVSYFSIPPDETDTKWAKAFWTTGGRVMYVRPDNIGRTRVFLCLTNRDETDERVVRLRKASKEDISTQKAVVQKYFEDAGWQVPRLLKGMQTSDDFYMQDVCQIRLNQWSKGRVTVCGDAGYCPSVYTGMGTSLAVIGAYVLAGEISKQPNNIPAALESYDRVLRPYVNTIQTLPPGIPWLATPQSSIGVKILQSCMWGLQVVSQSPLAWLLNKAFALLPNSGDDFVLPEYEAFKQSDEHRDEKQDDETKVKQ